MRPFVKINLGVCKIKLRCIFNYTSNGKIWRNIFIDLNKKNYDDFLDDYCGVFCERKEYLVIVLM